jgi:hypothetical protein
VLAAETAAGHAFVASGAAVTARAQTATGSVLTGELTAVGQRAARDKLATALGPVGWAVAVYCVSRLILLVVAGIVAVAGRHAFGPEFFTYDGGWYLRLAEHGYPARALHAKSTLGFFPLYSLAIRAVMDATFLSAPQAALIISFLGGLAAAVGVQRLATSWWGEQAGRRATVVFCLFPGSIVFSMAYSECLAIPLALGCLIALRSHHWWRAGLCAGLATAVEPVSLVLIPACLIAAAAQLRQHGWRDPRARRSLAAPLLAPFGIGAFAVFLWVWTGTPFAAYLAQHYGWHQQGQPLALLALPVAHRLFGHPEQLTDYIFAWNVWNGVFGGIFLAWSIWELLRVRHELGRGVIALAAGVAAVTLWSVMTPPNARLVLIAFPAVMVWGRRLPGRTFGLFVLAEGLALVLMSMLTFSGQMLP